jgi:hypothetical protein
MTRIVEVGYTSRWTREGENDGEDTPYTVKIGDFSCIFTAKWYLSVKIYHFSIQFTPDDTSVQRKGGVEDGGVDSRKGK